MNLKHILFDVAGGIARITINRPNEANALHLEAMQELHRCAIACHNDRGVRAVLLTGTGKMFCSGGDLKFFRAQGAKLADTVLQMTAHFHGAVSLLARLRAPTVCAVNGTAAGGGLSLAICNDLVIAAESARFTLAYTAAGLVPDGSSTWFLPRLVGMRRARELMLTNRMLSGSEAVAMGLADRVVPDAELMAAAEQQAALFAAGPNNAYAAVKRLLADTFQQSLEGQMEQEARAIAELAPGHDAQEGLAAFSERRKPKFSGD